MRAGGRDHFDPRNFAQVWDIFGGNLDGKIDVAAGQSEISRVGMREMMVAGLRSQEARIRSLHAIELANSESPVLTFNPLPPGKSIPPEPRPVERRRARPGT